MMGPTYGYPYDMMGGYGWLGGLLLLLFGALVVAGIVLLVIWAVRSAGHTGSTGVSPPSSGAAGHDEAVAIAKRRLASGEITREQYDEIMSALGG